MTARLFRKIWGRLVLLGLGLGMTALMFPSSLVAQPSDKETVVTFSAPFEIPGSNPQVLPAGTYRFRLVDSKSEPHIVQVSSNDGRHVYSTILAIAAHREIATPNTVMTFHERGTGTPEAIQTWFYPYDVNGEEFIYPPAGALQIAAATSTITAPAAPTPAPAPAPEVAQNPLPAPAPEPIQQAAAPPPEPPQQPAPAAAPAPQQNVQPAPAPEPVQQPAALPQTATDLPLMTLLGTVALGAGWMMRRRRL